MRCPRCRTHSSGHRALVDRPDPLAGDPTPDEICSSVGADLRDRPLPAAENTRAANVQLAPYGLKIVRGSVVVLEPTDKIFPLPPTVTDLNLKRSWGKPVGLFSGVSKMPGKAFSIPAGGFKSGGRCHVADFDVEKSICEGCYALQGQYLQATAQRAQWQRLMWIERTFNRWGPEGAGRALAIAIRWLARDPQRKSGGSRRRKDVVEASKFFRLHDSGAVYSPRYAQTWLAAACYLYLAAPPEIQIWVPMRIWGVALRQAKKEGGGAGLARRHPTLAPLVKMNQLPNVTVRPSALSWGKTQKSDIDPDGLGTLAPDFPGLSAGTGTWIKGKEVPSGYEFCSAPSQAGRCFGDIPDRKPRAPWKLVGERDGYEVYQKVRAKPRVGSPAGKVETKLRWMGGGERCTECWNKTSFVLYGEHGEGAASGMPAISQKSRRRMEEIRKVVQAHKNPKLVQFRSGRKNLEGRWMVLDPKTSTVFARLYSAPRARKLALKSDLLVVHDGTGQVFDPQSRRCVGMVMS